MHDDDDGPAALHQHVHQQVENTENERVNFFSNLLSMSKGGGRSVRRCATSTGSWEEYSVRDLFFERKQTFKYSHQQIFHYST